jgi:hypothetical protein
MLRTSAFVWVVAAVVGFAGAASAEMSAEQRIRILEEQLKRTQRELEELKGIVHRQKAAGEAVQRQAEQAAEEAKAVSSQAAKERAEADKKLADAAKERAEAEKKGRFPVRASYSIGKGINVRTEDDRFDISVYNRLQGRYTYTDQDTPGEDDTSTFRIRRFKTAIEGHAFYPQLLYKVQVNWVPDPELEDAFVHWKPRTWAGVQAGQYKVWFNRQQLTSSGAQQFVDRAITDDFFSFARDQGVSLTGSALGPKQDQLEWEAGIYNGNGINRSSNENSDHLGTARVLYMPLGAFKYYSESDVDDSTKPLFGVGAAYAYNSQAVSDASEAARIFSGGRLGTYFGEDFADDVDVQEFTADTMFKYRGFSVLGDFFFAKANPNSVGPKSAKGYNLQVGYFILPKRLEAAFRWAQIDRESDARRGQREVGGALGYFFFAHNLKIQADIRSIADQEPGEPDSDTMEYRLQGQVIF